MQNKLKLKGKRRWNRRNLARAGREIGADYVLYVKITRKGWLYTARARLVNTITNDVQMDFRSQFYDPVQDTPDRGERIGKRTLLKMQTLAEEGLLQISAPSPPLAPLGAPPVSARPPTVENPPLAPLTPKSPPADGAASAPTAAVPEIPDIEAPPLEMPGEGESTEGGAVETTLTERVPADPPSEPPLLAQATPSATERVEAQAPAPIVSPQARTATFRIDLSAGAGLLRRYDVSSASVNDSGLSFPLDPTSLVQAGLDVVIPGVGLGAEVDFSLRPVQYEVGTVGRAPDTPSGLLINTAVWATYHIIVAGEGERAVRLLPKVGGRLDMAPVDRHLANFVVSSTALAVTGGLELRWPVNDTLELGIAVDGGWIASYSEDPTTSGDSGAGFTVGGDLEVRIWLTSTVGIAFDSRYRYAQVDFDGPPTRQVPDAEQGQLENLTVATQDLLTSIGVALRF